MKRSLHLITLFSTLLITACASVTPPPDTSAEQNLLKDRRPHAVVVSDKKIESEAFEELNDTSDIQQNCHAAVNAYNGAALITGEAPTEALKAKVIAAVQAIPNVTLIQDHLNVEEPISLDVQENDKLITQSIRKAFNQIRSMHEFDPNTIKVITENGVVYLMGIVQRDEGKVIINLTKLQPGVRQIVTVFEYLD